jgi:hypothetical protein
MRRDKETITERDNCLYLRLASHVCTLGRRRTVDIDIDNYSACPAVQVRGANVPYVQTRAQESARALRRAGPGRGQR